MKFGEVMKQLMWDILGLLLREVYRMQGNDYCFTGGVPQRKKKRDNNVGMYSNLVYELIWSKFDQMIDTTKFYILILVYVTLILFQGHSDASKQNMCHLSHKLLNG